MSHAQTQNAQLQISCPSFFITNYKSWSPNNTSSNHWWTNLSIYNQRQECLLAIKTNIKSLPENLDESSYDLLEDTLFQGSFESVKLLRPKCAMTEVVAKFCPSSSHLELLWEAKIMNLVSSMHYLSTFYGLIFNWCPNNGYGNASTVAFLQGNCSPELKKMVELLAPTTHAVRMKKFVDTYNII